MFSLLKQLTGIGSTKMVIIIRTDLGMGKGKIASQAAHAAITLYELSLKSSNPSLNTWLRWGQPKVILKIDSSKQLDEIYQKAVANKLNVCRIYDAGRTQVDKGTLTAIGIGPNKFESINEITSHLKLL